MPRIRIHVALTALALLLLFSALSPRAGGTPPVVPPTVTISAHVDRIEDEWLVLDVPPHPSLPIPREMADWAEEGDAIVVSVQRARVLAEEERVGVILSPWRALVLERGPPLRLQSGEAGSTEFRWPLALAPKVRAGDRLDFAVERVRRKS